jgi:hypothetical protein
MLVDLLVTLVFVGIGRSVHDHGVSVAGLASTTWPFAVGIGAGWLLLLALHRRGTTPADGAIVALATVAVGMVLRVVSGQGTAAAFILVAVGFLGSLMVGWRAAYLAVASRPTRT